MNRIIIALALGGLACAGTGDPYAVPLPDYDRTKYREVGFAEGYAIGRIVYFIFPIPIRANDAIERATKLAIAANQGDAITNVTVTERYSYGLFHSRGVRVRGLVLKRIDPSAPESDYERGRREERDRIERERGGR